MHKIIDADPEKCNGCGICELICSASKTGIFSRRQSLIRIVRIEPTIDVALTCRFCEDPPCVACCPRNALLQREDGTILVDEIKCSGCGWCIEACDFGAITIFPQKHVAAICDLCEGNPKCVEWCPTEALHFVTSDIPAQKARISAVKKLFQLQK